MAVNFDDAVRDGDAYTLTAPIADIDAGDTMLLVKNTGNRNFRLKKLIINGGNVASVYDIHFQGTSTTAPTGTAVNAVPLNGRKDVGNGATDLVAKADETGYATQGSIIEEANVAAAGRETIDLHGMVLGTNQAIAVDQVTESTSGGATLVGWFE